MYCDNVGLVIKLLNCLVAVLSAVVAINSAVEKKNGEELIRHMESEASGLEMVDESLSNRYLNHFVSVKQEKAQV